MERGFHNGDARQRAPKGSTKESVQTPKIRTRKSSDGSKVSGLVFLIGLICVALGAFMLYIQSTKQLTTIDSSGQNELPKTSSQKRQGPAQKSSARKKASWKEQLQVGMQFDVGSYQTKENLVHIVDQVIRDRNNKIAVVRRLLAEEAPGIVISQSRLLIPEEAPAKINTSEWQFDYTYLHADYLRILLAAGRALGAFDTTKTSIQACVIGLGGASANTYLRYSTKNVNVTAVEIDASMVEVAKKFFGFIEDERQHSVVDDGVHFLGECVRKGKKFDVIILDACKNIMGFVACPVEAFVDSKVARLISQAMSRDGVLMINQLAIGVGPASHDTVKKVYGESFEGCIHYDVSGVNNKVIVCVKRHSQYKYMQSKQFLSDMHKHLLEFSFTV